MVKITLLQNFGEKADVEWKNTDASGRQLAFFLAATLMILVEKQLFSK